MKNCGKVFEQELKDSLKVYIAERKYYYYRFNDGTASFGGTSEDVRFQQSNICDCEVFNTESRTLYFLELKTHKGASIPFSAILGANKVSGLKKLRKMANANTYNGIVAGYLINFREHEKAYFVNAEEVEIFILADERKSIPLEWCKQYGQDVPMRKLRTNYRLDVENLIV